MWEIEDEGDRRLNLPTTLFPSRLLNPYPHGPKEDSKSRLGPVRVGVRSQELRITTDGSTPPTTLLMNRLSHKPFS